LNSWARFSGRIVAFLSAALLVGEYPWTDSAGFAACGLRVCAENLIRIDEARESPKLTRAKGQASDHTTRETNRHFAPFVSAPCEALGEGIDLIVMAPGKSQ